MTDAADPVVVVGAGPTGLTAALLLARQGVRTLVLDRHTVPFPHPRMVHLDDECVRILQQVGLDDGLLAISRPTAGMRMLDAGMRPFAVFRRDHAPGAHGFPTASLLEQPALEALLRDRVAREPLVGLRGGVVVTAAHEDASGVRVELEGGEELRASAVLGCDGAGSTVRAAIGGELRDLRFSQRWLVIDVTSDEELDTWGGIDQVCDPLRAATFLPLGEGRYRWAFRLYPDETVEELSRPGQVAVLLAPWVGHLDESGWALRRCGEQVVSATVAERWQGPHRRLFVLGTAAHQAPPFAGQGLSSGLRDAHNLAWKLAAVQAEEADPTLLDSYQAERAPHAEAAIRASVLIGNAMTGGGGRLAAVRQPAAVAMLRIPGGERRAARALTTRFPTGHAVQEREHRRDLPGTLCPQPTVRVGGVPARLDDVLGSGWALLYAGPVDTALRARAAQLGARSVGLAGRTGDTEPDHVVHDPGAVLATWLRRGRATAVLVRPDRVVAAVSRTAPGRRVARVAPLREAVRSRVRAPAVRWARKVGAALRRRRR